MSLISVPNPITSQEAPVNPSGEPKPGQSFNPLDGLRQHPIVALLIFALVTAVGVPYAWEKGTPLYEANTIIYVSPTFIKTLDEDKEQQQNFQYDTFAENQAKTINRFDICEEALKRLAAKGMYWQRKNESLTAAAARLQASLLIRRVPGTYQIAVSLSDPSPDLLAPVLDSVVNTFLEKSRDEEFYGRNERIRNLSAEESKMREEIDQKVAQRANLAEVLGSADAGKLEAPGDNLVVKTRAELEAAIKERLEAEAKIADTEAYIAAKTKTPPTAVVKMAEQDVEVVNAKDELSKRRDELLLRVNDPDAGKVLKDIARDELGRIDSVIQQAYAHALEKAAITCLGIQREELERARRAESRASSRLAAQGPQVRENSLSMFRSTDLANEIDHLRNRLAVVQDRIGYLNLEAHSPGFLRVYSAARRPSFPTAGGRKKMGLIVLGVALLLALAVPTILVLVDRKIRNGQVIEQMLGFPPIGLIMDRGQTKLKLGESFAEQQFLRLLSGIDRARRSSNAKLFVLTSVKHGGGTSSVVERISQALKQQGLRIAVVTPTRNSAEYPTIGDKSQPVQGEGFVERIYLPVCDPSVGMFSTNRLTAIFDKLKRDYDLVLVDAPPLLMSAETEILVCMCQATLLVVEADHITKEDLLKAAKLLERLRPEATGVILNRVKIKTAGWHLRREYREYTNGLNSKETIRPAA